MYLTAKDLAAGAKSKVAIDLLKEVGAKGLCRKGKFGGWVHWADDWDDDEDEEEKDVPMWDASAQPSSSSTSRWVGWEASATSSTSWEESRQSSWHDAPWHRR